MSRARSVNRGTSPMHAVTRWGATLSLVAGSALAFGLLGLAGTALAAEACPLTDPSCVVGTADQTAHDAQGTAGDSVAAAQEQAQAAASELQGTVNKAVNDLLGKSGGGPGGGGGSGGGNHGGGSGGGAGAGGSGTRGAGSGIATTTGTTAGSRGQATRLLATSDGFRGRAPNAHAGGIVPALGEAVVGVAIPLLLLLGLVVTFSAAQDRIDRRDPKLNLAPLGPDVVRFE